MSLQLVFLIIFFNVTFLRNKILFDIILIKCTLTKTLIKVFQIYLLIQLQMATANNTHCYKNSPYIILRNVVLLCSLYVKKYNLISTLNFALKQAL